MIINRRVRCCLGPLPFFARAAVAMAPFKAQCVCSEEGSVPLSKICDVYVVEEVERVVVVNYLRPVHMALTLDFHDAAVGGAEANRAWRL